MKRKKQRPTSPWRALAGGLAGGLLGTRSAQALADRRGALNIVFAMAIIAVALYMLSRNLSLT